MLRIYKSPPAFDEKMNAQARNILKWSIPIYCVACIWVLGNPNILEKTDILGTSAQAYADNMTTSNLDSFFGGLIKFFDRATNVYGLPFFLILILFILQFVLSFIFADVLGLVVKLLFGCCKVNLKKDETKRDMWFDALVSKQEMDDEADLYNSLNKKLWYKNEAMKTFVKTKL